MATASTANAHSSWEREMRIRREIPTWVIESLDAKIQQKIKAYFNPTDGE